LLKQKKDKGFKKEPLSTVVVRKQRRATNEDVERIFLHRGCGFSMEQISEIVDLSPQTISYQLSKLKNQADEYSINSVVERLGFVTWQERQRMKEQYDSLIFDLHEAISEKEDEISQLVDEIQFRSQYTDEELELHDKFQHYDDIDWFIEENIPDSVSQRGVVIDASNVIFHLDLSEDDQADFFSDESPLTQMINALESKGLPVLCVMGELEYDFAISGEMPDFSPDQIVSLKSLKESGKMELLKDEERLTELLDRLLTNAKYDGREPVNVASNDPSVGTSEDCIHPKIGFEWFGPVCRFSNLPSNQIDSKTEPPVSANRRAKGAVLSMVSQGEWTPIPAIHDILASIFLSYNTESRPVGWPLQLKESLSLEGKSFSAQLSNLMGDSIEFNPENNLVRRR
jgi:hypothetical protein